MNTQCDIEEVYEQIRNDPAFKHLRQLNNPLIPGEGNGRQVFIIGEAPGAQEVIARRPFVGESGVVLRQLMEIAGLHSWFSDGSQYRPNCWLTNVLKYRPPNNRTPTYREIRDSRPYLRAEWLATGCALLIIPVGRPALEAVMGKPASILECAGRPFYRVGKVISAMMTVWPMLHPSYGLRNPSARPLMEDHWNDLAGFVERYL